MLESRSRVASLGACIAAGLAAACATPSKDVPRAASAEVGSPCDGSWTAPTQGVVIVPFAGTVIGLTADGTRRPLSGASFVVVAGAQHGRLPVGTDAQGRFEGKVLLPTRGSKECRDGVVKAGYVIGSATISVRAKKCADLEVTVEAGWEPRPIELRCEE